MGGLNENRKLLKYTLHLNEVAEAWANSVPNVTVNEDANEIIGGDRAIQAITNMMDYSNRLIKRIKEIGENKTWVD